MEEVMKGTERSTRTADRTPEDAPAREDFDRGEAMRDTPFAVETERTRDWETGVQPQRTSDVNSEVCLFSDSEVGDLRSRWNDVQAEFVDEPKRAVREADQLVRTVVQKLTSGFANERMLLEKQWDSGADVSTEELRVALQRYRAFFGKLLNAA